jgi:small subunit ribosomal protein S16
VKIRLMRVGKKKQPSYRVVVADGRSPRDGRYIEIIGHYQPRHEPSGFDIDGDKVLAWLHKGAQPTEQVHKLLVGAGIWDTYESGRSSQSTAAKTAARRAKGQAGAQAEKAKAKAAADAKAAAEAKAAEEAVAAEAASASADAADEAPGETAADAPSEEAAATEGESE